MVRFVWLVIGGGLFALATSTRWRGAATFPLQKPPAGSGVFAPLVGGAKLALAVQAIGWLYSKKINSRGARSSEKKARPIRGLSCFRLVPRYELR